MKVVKVISLCGLLAVLTTGCSGNKEPSLVLNKTSLSLYQEDTFTLTAEMKNSKGYAYQLFTWSSSNEDVVTVYSGEVTAVGVGTAIITVKPTFNDNYSAQCEVTVTREPGFDYEIGPAAGTVMDDYYRFHIPVKNTGTMNIYLYRMKYEINNKYGDQLYESYLNMYATPKIIAPGETGYFYDTPYNSYGSFKDKTSDDLVVIQHPTIKKAKDYKCERYTVSEPTIENSFGRPLIKGTLTNNSSARIAKPAVAVQLFDKNDKFIYCFNTIFQEGINPGETKEYSVSIPNYGGEQIEESEIAKINPIAYDDVTRE